MSNITTMLLSIRKTISAMLLLLLMPHLSPAQWTAKSSLTTAGRDASVIFTINNKIYLAGGSSNKDFWRYDPVANTWTQLADIPGTSSYRGFAVGFALNGKGYVGLGADTTIYTVERDLWEYDTAANTWTQKASLPAESRDGAFSFVINNIAYIGGGNDSAGYLENDFWAYNPTTNAWSQKATLPDYTIFPFAFSIGNYGYISCGQQGAAETTATWQYDPVANTWAAKAAFPGTARQAGTAFVLDSLGYCGLGMVGYTTPYEDFYNYNAKKDTWSSLGNFPGGTDAWPVSAVADNKGYVGTGWNFGSTFFDYWYQYTPPATAVSAVTRGSGDIIVYPNPATETLYVNIPPQKTGNIYTYSINNMIGQQLRSGTLTHTIDIHGLPSGNYLLKIGINESIQVKVITVD